jgi:hypothetical protein
MGAAVVQPKIPNQCCLLQSAEPRANKQLGRRAPALPRINLKSFEEDQEAGELHQGKEVLRIELPRRRGRQARRCAATSRRKASKNWARSPMCRRMKRTTVRSRPPFPEFHERLHYEPYPSADRA